MRASLNAETFLTRNCNLDFFCFRSLRCLPRRMRNFGDNFEYTKKWQIGRRRNSGGAGDGSAIMLQGCFWQPTPTRDETIYVSETAGVSMTQFTNCFHRTSGESLPNWKSIDKKTRSRHWEPPSEAENLRQAICIIHLCVNIFIATSFSLGIETLTREIYSPFEWICFRFLAPLVVLHFNFSQILHAVCYCKQYVAHFISNVSYVSLTTFRDDGSSGKVRCFMNPTRIIASVSYVRSLNNYKSSLKSEQEVTPAFQKHVEGFGVYFKACWDSKIKEQLK